MNQNDFHTNYADELAGVVEHWAVKYIGLSYKEGGRDKDGVDCWGLLRLVYANEFGIILPEIPGISVASLLTTCNTVVREKDSWNEISVPEDGCAVAMGLKQIIHHVGIFTSVDGGRVIHCWEKQNAVADTLRRIQLKGILTIKFFRHHLWPIS